MFRAFPPRFIAFTALILTLGAGGGYAMSLVGAPMPFMLGSLMVSALAVWLAEARFPQGYRFPMKFRMIFISIIGVMIGAQVEPSLLTKAPAMAVSLSGVVIFVALAHWTSYRLLRRLGGFDPATAYYASSPGGLIESIALGEAAGGDVRMITIQQFLRIITVVTFLPIGLALWEGHVVGSAAGMSLAHGETGLRGIAEVLAAGLAGLWLGHRLRLPAWQLVGPLVVAAVAGGAGLAQFNAPGWLVSIAQVVLGTSLGLRFVGVNRQMLQRGAALSLVTVGAMLAIGLVLSFSVSALTGLPVDVLVISYAPGGVTEMSLIALSLSVNPALVTLHHLFRIILTVVMMSLNRRLGFVRM